VRVLVTGSTGCLGSNICKHLLKEGYEVRALLRESSSTEAIDDLPVERVLGDVTDYKSLVQAMDGCTWVFHTAAFVTYWKKNWEAARQITVVGTENVVQAALKVGVKRLIHTSSIATIGTTGNPRRIPDENWPFDEYKWKIPYHATKRQSEESVMEGARQGLDVVICNPSIIFGERDVKLNAAKVFRMVQFFYPFYPAAGGSAICDADDVAIGHIRAAERGRCGERYIMCSENLSARDYFTLAAEVSGQRKPWIPLLHPVPRLITVLGERSAERKGQAPIFNSSMPFIVNRHIFGSPEKARRELGFGQTSGRDSMMKEYRWLDEHHKLRALLGKPAS